MKNNIGVHDALGETLAKSSAQRRHANARSSISHQQRQETLAGLAEHTLTFFTNTATFAKAQLAGLRLPSPDVFASMNTMTTEKAVQRLVGISEDQRRELATVSQEPAIARVVALNERDEKEIYFIARGTTGQRMEGLKVASYRSPMGRLVALPIGDELEWDTKNGFRSLKVIEKTDLRPSLIGQDWDSIDSVIQSIDFDPVTVVSFRALSLPPAAKEDEDDGAALLDAMLSEGQPTENIIDGIQRSVITKMGLRDRPYLDKYQDEIYRLPLATQLILLGPPGSGKTTTLIKRLGLKIDLTNTGEEDEKLIEQTLAGRQGHAQSWIMFTPTELLKLYVKEAFSRENVPAPDERIWTWSDYRRELARNRLPILRTSSGPGSFVLRDGLGSLQSETVTNQIAWFEDFDAWQANAFWTDLKQHADRLAGDPDQSVSRLGKQLLATVSGVSGRLIGASFSALADRLEEIQTLIARLRKETDLKIRESFARELKKDNSLLDNLATLLSTLQDTNEDPDDQDVEDDEEIRVLKPGREAAFDAYTKAARAHARATVSGRSLGRQSRHARIIEWMGNRALSGNDLRMVGASVQVQTSARQFVNPLSRYLNRMPFRYRRFRRERQGEGRWYQPEGFAPTDLAPLETDAILLAMLQAARGLLQDRRILREIDLPRHSTLKTVRDLFRTQVLVDEATDFSPLQLGCMAALCDPVTNAFLACGDFNQRITEWGSRSADDLKWVFPTIDIRTIDITYRHSRQLNELARNIVLISNPEAQEAQLPPDVNSDAVAPVLAKNLSDPAEIAGWLAARIGEIERFTKSLPSIAVLVNTEDEVQPVADTLNEALAGLNLRAVACLAGQAVGQENDVRVFDVQHIKGLEFEAVFFLGIDDLAQQLPDLFDKYLYVGATRAATYLGITTTGPDLPSKIRPLEASFGEDWPRG